MQELRDGPARRLSMVPGTARLCCPAGLQLHMAFCYRVIHSLLGVHGRAHERAGHLFVWLVHSLMQLSAM